MHNMQNAHRVNRVQHIANLRQSINALQQRIRELEAQVDRQEHAMNGLRDDNQTAQLLIAHYKADEDEAAELERRGKNRLMRDRERIEEEIDALTQDNEGLRVRLVDETKKYERMLRDRNAFVKNLAEAEKVARRQLEELAARDATIIQLRDKLDKVTVDSNKKTTKIEDLRGDSSKKSAKVDDLRSQRTGLRNRLDEQVALHQVAVEEKDSEIASMREILKFLDLSTVETPSMLGSNGSSFPDTSGTCGHSAHSSDCNPHKWSDHSTSSRPTLFHVCGQRGQRASKQRIKGPGRRQ